MLLKDRRIRFRQAVSGALRGKRLSAGRTLAEETLSESEKTFRSLASSVDAMYLVDRDCRYLHANENLLATMGLTLEEIAGLPYGDFHDEEETKLFNEMVEDVFKTNDSFQDEHKSCRDDRYYLRTLSPVRDAQGIVTGVTVISKDITERKLAEERQILVNEILRLLNNPNEIANLLRNILARLKEHTGIEAAAIRLCKNGDFPYYETNGFPPHFIEAENYLCSRDHKDQPMHDPQGNPYIDCMCGNVICGRTDPSLPFFTKGGSFWTNSTTKLLASTSEADRQARTRNRCNGDGYESVALIPLKSGEETIGLLQLNDKRPDLFALDMIQFLEGLGESIGIAIRRLQAEEELGLRANAMASAINGIAITDISGKLTYANLAALKLWGYDSEEEILGRPAAGFWRLEEETIPFVRTLKNTESSLGEMTAVRKDGSLFVAEIAVSLVRNTFGQPIHIVGSFLDITERKRAEDLLRGSERKYRHLFNNAGIGMFRERQDGSEILDINGKCLAIFGRTREEMQGSPSVIHWADPREREELLRRLEVDDYVTDFECGMLNKRGEVRNCLSSIHLYRDESILEGSIIDITEHKKIEKEEKRSVERLRKTLGAAVQAMAVTVETRDPYTAGHQKRVADLCRAIATEMGLSADQIDGIRTAGIIHDLGKISVPAEILSKPTKLTEIEFSLIKTHSQAGYNVLKDIEFPWPIARIVLEHHERMDGSGYPNGLKGDEILIESRILAIADVVESMASHRPYRPSLGIGLALEEITRNKGVLYDTAAADACLKLFHEKKYILEI